MKRERGTVLSRTFPQTGRGGERGQRTEKINWDYGTEHLRSRQRKIKKMKEGVKPELG